MSKPLPPRQRKLIAARKQIEYDYARPFLPPTIEGRSESELRESVRRVIMEDLPPEDRLALAHEKQQALREINREFDTHFHP